MIREVTNRRKPKEDATINDKNGKALTDNVQIRTRWKEYIEELYESQKKPELEDLLLESRNGVDDDMKRIKHTGK